MNLQWLLLIRGDSLSGAKKQVRRWIVPAGRKEKLLIATTSHPGGNSKLIVNACMTYE